MKKITPVGVRESSCAVLLIKKFSERLLPVDGLPGRRSTSFRSKRRVGEEQSMVDGPLSMAALFRRGGLVIKRKICSGRPMVYRLWSVVFLRTMVFLTIHFSLFTIPTLHAQTIKPLTVGDVVPDIVFTNLINTKEKKAKLSDFKGKLVILDLWSNHCRACIEAFPKMEAIQNKFKNNLQILFANPHVSSFNEQKAATEIVSGFQQRTGIQLTIPIALGDTVLNALFPHQRVPHIIVLDSNRKVLAITSAVAINEKMLGNILAGAPYWLPQKNDSDFDHQQPLFTKGNAGDGSRYLYRSLITGYLDGADPYIGWDKTADGSATRYYIINYPLRDLFRLAWPDVLSGYANRIVVEAADPSRFDIFKDTAQDLSLLYTYELSMPATAPQVFKQRLVADLEQYFQATAVTELRTINCYLLKKQGNLNRYAGNPKLAARQDIDPFTKNKVLINQPMQTLMALLNDRLQWPVIDSSGISQPISLKLPYNIYQFTDADWKLFLQQQGLVLEESSRPMEMGVIKNIR